MGLFDRKAAAPKQPPQPQQKHGPVHGVPCPWCDHKNDFREEHETGMLDPQMQPDYECVACHRMLRIAKVQQITMISVIPSPRNAELMAKRRR